MSTHLRTARRAAIVILGPFACSISANAQGLPSTWSVVGGARSTMQTSRDTSVRHESRGIVRMDFAEEPDIVDGMMLRIPIQTLRGSTVSITTSLRLRAVG